MVINCDISHSSKQTRAKDLRPKANDNLPSPESQKLRYIKKKGGPRYWGGLGVPAPEV